MLSWNKFVLVLKLDLYNVPYCVFIHRFVWVFITIFDWIEKYGEFDWVGYLSVYFSCTSTQWRLLVTYVILSMQIHFSPGIIPLDVYLFTCMPTKLAYM